jgi:hypothetical protein
LKVLSSVHFPPSLEPRTRVAVAAEYVLVVIDKDRRRRRPLAEHSGLSSQDADELVRVNHALGYSLEQIHVDVADSAKAA